MAGNKTKQTAASVETYIAAIEDPLRRKDCELLARLMSRATGERPAMWGAAIVGFGAYHYQYASGREGDACRVGFSSRKGDISIYVMADFPERAALLAGLGKHKASTGCIYVRTLGDIDTKALERLVAAAYADNKRRYG